MLTLIVKIYKTISIKYNLKQNITILNSIAHGFFNIFTADMIHDLKSVHSNTFSKSSHQMSNITDNPLDESFYNQPPGTNQSRDRTRHPSQNQSPSPSTTNNRDTKTHYNLRQQPKMEYRIFIRTSNL